MAILLTERPKNLTEYPNSFKRQGAFPLDSTLCWYSLAAAKAYAQTDNTAYVGQIVTVIEGTSIKHYSIMDTAGTLKEIAFIDSIPESSSTGTKTYTSLEDASNDLLNLTQGQLITVVDEQSAYAYIVGYNNEKLFDVAASNTPQNEISTTSIDSIIDGTYQSNNVTSNISTQTSTIDAILNNEYTGEATDEQKLIIDSIIDGTYEEV